jgi:hypothetical protein
MKYAAQARSATVAANPLPKPPGPATGPEIKPEPPKRGAVSRALGALSFARLAFLDRGPKAKNPSPVPSAAQRHRQPHPPGPSRAKQRETPDRKRENPESDKGDEAAIAAARTDERKRLLRLATSPAVQRVGLEAALPILCTGCTDSEIALLLSSLPVARNLSVIHQLRAARNPNIGPSGALVGDGAGVAGTPR